VGETKARPYRDLASMRGVATGLPQLLKALGVTDWLSWSVELAGMSCLCGHFHYGRPPATVPPVFASSTLSSDCEATTMAPPITSKCARMKTAIGGSNFIAGASGGDPSDQPTYWALVPQCLCSTGGHCL
jgi:hypothetical protein